MRTKAQDLRIKNPAAERHAPWKAPGFIAALAVIVAAAAVYVLYEIVFYDFYTNTIVPSREIPSERTKAYVHRPFSRMLFDISREDVEYVRIDVDYYPCKLTRDEEIDLVISELNSLRYCYWTPAPGARRRPVPGPPSISVKLKNSECFFLDYECDRRRIYFGDTFYYCYTDFYDKMEGLNGKYNGRQNGSY